MIHYPLVVEDGDDNLMFDAGVLDDEVVMPGKKEEQGTKFDDMEVSTANEAITTAGVKDSAIAPTIAAAPTITTAVEVVTIVSAPTTTIDELTLAQTLIEIKAAKPKTVIAVTTTATTITTTVVTRPMTKGVVIQESGEKTIRKERSAKIILVIKFALDEENGRELEAQLQAELREEERKERQKEEEANIALIKSWENTQAMMEAGRLLAERLQTREREELTDEEKTKLFVELMEKRRKHFVALRSQEKRNKPPTKAQKRNPKSQESSGKKDESSSKKAEIVQDDSAKRAGDELESDVSKKQKVQEQLIRAYESSKRYSSMINMLQRIDREDLETPFAIRTGRFKDDISLGEVIGINRLLKLLLSVSTAELLLSSTKLMLLVHELQLLIKLQLLDG
ncbi:hypothetical protein Tco_0327927 [Tanacetum coccineum]